MEAGISSTTSRLPVERRCVMADQKTVVIGIYATHAALEAGVQSLKNAGFRNTAVSVLYPEKRKVSRSPHTENEARSEGAPGEGTQKLVGGVLGWLAGAGSLVIPGIAPLIAVGPIVGTLAVTGSTEKTGGIAGGLGRLGLTEADAKAFEQHLREGRSLLSVHPDNDYWATRAIDTMQKSGAQQICTGGTRERQA